MIKLKKEYSCPICGKEIHYTSKMCRHCINSGNLNPNFKKGKSHCIDCSKEISYSWKGQTITRCRECFIKFNKGTNHSNYIDGRSNKDFYCIDCNEKVTYQTWYYGNQRCGSCARKGDKNPSFIDNRTNRWKEIRTKCFERDGYTCILCSQKGIYLNAHHIINRHECTNFFDLDNLVTLCKGCHTRITNIEKTDKYLKYKVLFMKYINRRIVLKIDEQGNWVVGE